MSSFERTETCELTPTQAEEAVTALAGIPFFPKNNAEFRKILKLWFIDQCRGCVLNDVRFSPLDQMRWVLFFAARHITHWDRYGGLAALETAFIQQFYPAVPQQQRPADWKREEDQCILCHNDGVLVENDVYRWCDRNCPAAEKFKREAPDFVDRMNRLRIQTKKQPTRRVPHVRGAVFDILGRGSRKKPKR